MKRTTLQALIMAGAMLGLSLPTEAWGGSQPVLTIYAAASLRETVTAIAADYEKRAGTQVRLEFDASSTLARRIAGGAPVPGQAGIGRKLRAGRRGLRVDGAREEQAGGEAGQQERGLVHLRSPPRSGRRGALRP